MKPLISSTRVEEGARHDRVHVWNRGSKAGVLVVESGDGCAVSARLLDDNLDGSEDGADDE